MEVTSAAPLVQADNADLSTNFNQTLIANQPNGGNDITYVAQTAPGVTMNTGLGYGNFSSSGLPATSNLFTVNGENDMDPYLNLNNSGATNLTLGKNDVQEATVITNAYSGQYGQQAGAQVSYVTKSGTNQFHGNAEYWWTGRAMDANDWFNNLNSTPRPFANNNEWAASFGGPIKKDKLFFFVDNEGIRYIVPSTEPVFAPTPTFMQPNFATAPGQPGGDRPGCGSAVHEVLFNLLPGTPRAIQRQLTDTARADGGTATIPGCIRVDNCYRPVSGQRRPCPARSGSSADVSTTTSPTRTTCSGGYAWTMARRRPMPIPSTPAFSAASYQPAYDGQGQWTHVFSPNATNQFVYAGSYYRAIFTQNDSAADFPYAVDWSWLRLRPHVGGNAYRFPQGRNVTQYQFVDDFSWTKGAHALKFGAQLPPLRHHRLHLQRPTTIRWSVMLGDRRPVLRRHR